MAIKVEGIWGCTVLGGKSGEADGVPFVQVTVQIDDGPSKGMRGTYEDEVNAKTGKYVAASLKAVGYSGRGLDKLEEDITKWVAKTGGKTTVEVKHIEIKRGKAYDKWVAGGEQGDRPVWDKIQGLGRGGARALNTISKGALNDANAALREAMGAPDDVPPDDDSLPFISCSAREASPIAKVLR